MNFYLATLPSPWENLTVRLIEQNQVVRGQTRIDNLAK